MAQLENESLSESKRGLPETENDHLSDGQLVLIEPRGNPVIMTTTVAIDRWDLRTLV